MIWFLAAAEADEIARDADEAAIDNRTPRPSPQAAAARQAAALQTPPLLATWRQQPPTVRLELVRLAALDPDSTRTYRDAIVGFAASIAGTREYIGVTMALAMIDNQYDHAVHIARTTAEWSEGGHYRELQEAPGLTDRTRAELALRDGAIAA